jgi:membrane protease YdiL (CAAX protease family)
MQFLLMLLVFSILAGSMVVWSQTIRRLVAGGQLLAWQRGQIGHWGLVDIFLASAALILLQLAILSVLGRLVGFTPSTSLEDVESGTRAAMLLGNSLATLVALIVTLVWLLVRYRITWRAIGVHWIRLSNDVTLGLRAFLLLAPIVYGVQLILVKWFGESSHPLLKLLREDPDPRFFLLSAFAALLVAPIAEEVYFRLLLQGWLQRLCAVDNVPSEIVVGGLVGEGDADQQGVSTDGSQRERGTVRNTVPIAISSLFFALAHYSHGPDPIALFVFALGLGFLFQRVQRIVPCIVLHFLLNSTSMASLVLLVYVGPE